MLQQHALWHVATSYLLFFKTGRKLVLLPFGTTKAAQLPLFGKI
jgi:hypothetical protein